MYHVLKIPSKITSLFDMTLVDSTAAVEGAWATYGERYPHLDVPSILQITQGVRSVDNMRRFVLAPGTPEDLCEAEADKFEIEIVASARRAKEQGKDGIIYLPGTESILAVARAASVPEPKHAWAICTSATPVYASSALSTVGIPVPSVFVTARDVTHGKPYPDPYLLGAKKCGIEPQDCVVFEDAPSGIRSGKAAGCKVIALLTSHSREAVEAAEPDVIVEDLSHVEATWEGDHFALKIV
ncbi:haloacid dehalogenase [Ceratobasidium sp. AG-Ba]|nr:haloacid dehalogenase [Ceratobasidium sp. AG-Ba]QRW01464.1 haloacid dehalogenase [Ceratobasidium sp. AG-Ba]